MIISLVVSQRLPVAQPACDILSLPVHNFKHNMSIPDFAFC